MTEEKKKISFYRIRYHTTTTFIFGYNEFVYINKSIHIISSIYVNFIWFLENKSLQYLLHWKYYGKVMWTTPFSQIHDLASKLVQSMTNHRVQYKPNWKQFWSTSMLDSHSIFPMLNLVCVKINWIWHSLKFQCR